MTLSQTAANDFQLDLATATYSKALRAIGQDLAELFPRTLEIESDGVNFEARGDSHPNPFETVRESIFVKTWNKLFKKSCLNGHGERHFPTATFSRSYGPEEIERIERMNSASRTGTLRRADSYSLAERLRTMGAIVDSKQGRLKRLSKDCDRLFDEYWDQQGQLQSAKLTTVILYRRQQQPERQPSDAPLELWEGYDF
jgi:hypothetical protein